MVVNAETGMILHSVEFDTLPLWDGSAGAQGMLFLTTLDRRKISFSGL